jgi:hypothetical protein
VTVTRGGVKSDPIGPGAAYSLMTMILEMKQHIHRLKKNQKVRAGLRKMGASKLRDLRRSIREGQRALRAITFQETRADILIMEATKRLKALQAAYRIAKKREPKKEPLKRACPRCTRVVGCTAKGVMNKHTCKTKKEKRS